MFKLNRPLTQTVLTRTIVADGTPEAAKRIERVLTSDPGMCVVRYVDAGYEEAIDFAERNDVKIPMTYETNKR